jgi:hypothetical protein
VQPSNGTVGAALTPAIQVGVYDQTGKLMYGVGVVVALGANPAGASLGGTPDGPSAPFVFGDLSIDKLGTGYTLVASLPSWPNVSPITSAPFDVVDVRPRWTSPGKGGVFYANAVVAGDGRIYTASPGAGMSTNTFNAYPGQSVTDPNNFPPNPAVVAPISPSRGGGSFTLVTGLDGRIYALGGMDSTGNNAVSTAQVYDPSTDVWSSIASMPTPHLMHAAACGSDGRIYAIGGYVPYQGYSAAVEVFTPGTGTWASAASLPTARQDLAAATGADGRIYTFGGVGASGISAAAEVYDPTLGTWSSISPLSRARYGHAAAPGADGRVYVIGGQTGATDSTVTGLVEAFSPTTGTWSIAPPLIAPSTGLAALNMRDGRIVVLGGSNFSGIYEDVLENFGPLATLTPASATPGTTVTVTGSNFGASANVKVYWGPATGAPIATGTTDANGAMNAGLTFTVPASSPGPAKVTVVDDRASYPFTASFTVN